MALEEDVGAESLRRVEESYSELLIQKFLKPHINRLRIE